MHIVGWIRSKKPQKRLWGYLNPLCCHGSGVIITYMTIGIAGSDLNIMVRALRHVLRRQTSRHLFLIVFVALRRIANKQDPARNFGGTIHQTSGINSRHFHFPPPLNDNFRAPRDKREFGNEKNGMARPTGRRDGAGGYSAVCFSPDLTTRLINWLFCFNTAFPAPPVAAPRGRAASKSRGAHLFDSFAGTFSTLPSSSGSPSRNGLESSLCLLNNLITKSSGLFSSSRCSHHHTSAEGNT